MFEQEIQLIKNHQNIFLACSGGMDSMALAHCLLEHCIPFSIAHCNFNLRENEALKDEKFVEDFCTKNNIPFYLKSFNTKDIANQNGWSIEQCARNLRYDFFNQLSKSHNIELFLTAHHRNDLAETVLMRIVQGTGIKGLKGIPMYRTPNFFRPFLDITKRELIFYVSKNKIAYRTDSSNFSTDYLRNKYRLEIIPLLEAINPEVCQHLVQLSKFAIEADDLLEETIATYKEQWMTKENVDLNKFKGKSYLTSVLYALLVHLNPNQIQIETLKKHLFSPEVKYINIHSAELFVKNGLLELVKPIIEIDFRINDPSEWSNGKEITAVFLHQKPPIFEINYTYLDAQKIKYPITIKSNKEGLYMKPLGMSGKSKKVSDILQKLSPNQKANALVIIDNDQEVLAIIGHSTAEKAKWNSTTTQILALKIM